MKILLYGIIPVLLILSGSANATGGTNVDTIQFIQYLDENTALEEVRNGNLDMYYYRIASDRIEGTESKKGLKIYESTGGSYSMLVNPAESEKFNPFSIKEVRFALNYLIDRKLIVNELMGGYGVSMISNYGPFDSEYLTILNELEQFQFKYNPKLASKIISDALTAHDAQKIDGKWHHKEIPVQVTIFIRSDDPVRKSIGEIFASELEQIGFEVKKDFGDLNKAFVIVYGSNPADIKWNLYTEGWGGRSAFVRYDSTGLAQMYSPWFSNMPGFNDPSYWNYKNDRLDELTQKIYTGDFASAEQRNKLIQNATVEAVNESVRIFLASKIDQYVVNENVKGVINDFGAGVPTRFTPINARGDDTTLTIGVKQIYQGAWNPVRGLTDSYSTHIWNTLYDPGVFKHPFTGNTIPIRAQWEIQTNGGDEKIMVPDDAIIWDPKQQSWVNVTDTEATSKVVFDLEFSNWHNGIPMDIYDVMYSVYFALEWGTALDENDKTFDTEYTPQAAQMISTLVAIRPIGDTQIEVYVDYWHFDEAEIAAWAEVWSSMPWEIYTAMEKSVLDGKVSFSRSGAVSKNVNWLSLLVPNDSTTIKNNLLEFKENKVIPNSLKQFGIENQYVQKRYDASIGWIDEKNHAVISNGPFYLQAYYPESRTISIASFDDTSYPFQKGHWSKYERVDFPQITKMQIPAIIQTDKLNLEIETKSTSELKYFISNSDGIVNSQQIKIKEDKANIDISDTENLKGVNNIKIFAISDTVLRPDFYSASFIVSDETIQEANHTDTVNAPQQNDNQTFVIIILAGIILGLAVYLKLRARTQMQR